MQHEHIYISEISAICLGRMQYLREFHISEISAICLGCMHCLWEFQISVFVGVSHLGDIGDMFVLELTVDIVAVHPLVWLNVIWSRSLKDTAVFLVSALD